MGASFMVDITGDPSCQFSVNGGATWPNISTAIGINGTFDVRVTTANAVSTACTCTVNIGGTAATWTVTTTNGQAPNAFTFTDVTGQLLNTLVVEVGGTTLTGMLAAGPISITGDASCKYTWARAIQLRREPLRKTALSTCKGHYADGF